MTLTEPGSDSTLGTLQDQVDALDWYHTFDLPGGIVTRGVFDHRRVADKVPFPDLTGKRCLDAASSDGFWAFEMARRGAASVTSLDLADATRQDWQGLGPDLTANLGSGRAAQAFEVVKNAYGMTNVDRVDGSLYDANPEWLGEFDFVFMGNILLHLSDPARALRAVRSVCKGQFLSYEMTLLLMSLLRPRTPTAQLWHTNEARWWTMNIAAHRRMVRACGFEIIKAGGPVRQPFGDGLANRPTRPYGLRVHGPIRLATYWLFVRPFGPATSWVLST